MLLPLSCRSYRLERRASGRQGGAGVNKRLLVVEDDPALARGLDDNFRDEGYEVRIVGHGDEALPAVAAFRPDLLVLDIMLPGRSGLDILRDLRARGDDLRANSGTTAWQSHPPPARSATWGPRRGAPALRSRATRAVTPRSKVIGPHEGVRGRSG